MLEKLPDFIKSFFTKEAVVKQEEVNKMQKTETTRADTVENIKSKDADSSFISFDSSIAEISKPGTIPTNTTITQNLMRLTSQIIDKEHAQSKIRISVDRNITYPFARAMLHSFFNHTEFKVPETCYAGMSKEDIKAFKEKEKEIAKMANDITISGTEDDDERGISRNPWKNTAYLTSIIQLMIELALKYEIIKAKEHDNKIDSKEQIKISSKGRQDVAKDKRAKHVQESIVQSGEMLGKAAISGGNVLGSNISTFQAHKAHAKNVEDARTQIANKQAEITAKQNDIVNKNTEITNKDNEIQQINQGTLVIPAGRTLQTYVNERTQLGADLNTLNNELTTHQGNLTQLNDMLEAYQKDGPNSAAYSQSVHQMGQIGDNLAGVGGQLHKTVNQTEIGNLEAEEIKLNDDQQLMDKYEREMGERYQATVDNLARLSNAISQMIEKSIQATKQG